MISRSISVKRTGALLLVGTVLGGASTPLLAQDAAPAPTAAAPSAPATTPPADAAIQAPAAPVEMTIRSISVTGNQRLEPATIRAYANLNPGTTYTTETLDQALKNLYATQLFADVRITGGETGSLILAVKENPVINRIILEGNKKLKDDKINPEIKLAPRQIFTRSGARADVDRILALYRTQGRFGAKVEPKIVQLDQNRVDVVFEITEGDLAKVRAINILGNDHYDDARLRKEMYTREAGGALGFLKSNTTYDPDRLAADQQKLRAFYLTQGYADFRVVSALAELTPDRDDFVITYVVEEGPRYRFGTVQADSALRDFTNAQIMKLVPVKSGNWFNAKQVEDTVTGLNQAAGILGYAFADINPAYDRDPAKKLMNVTFKVGETPRVYVERVDITGNTTTRDKVIRREFRLNEGDAFNALKVRRSQDRVQSLGYFQDKLEVKQTEGSAPDRVVLGLNVEEKPTGQLSLSGGYSSLERFVVQLSVAQNNFMGKGQQATADVSWSQYSKSASVGFADPYFLDKPILLGGQLFRRDYSSYNFIGNQRNTTYKQVSTGAGLRMGFPITEYWTFAGRYTLQEDKISLDKTTFYTDGKCDPLKAGAYLCDEVGSRLSSVFGYSTAFDNTDGIHPTRGQNALLSADFAGLGGNVKYFRVQVNATKYKSIGAGFIVSLHGEGGYIKALSAARTPFLDPIRISDRFFGPQLRGFDIRGIGPRVQRTPYNDNGTLATDQSQTADAIGGKAYYMGRLELEIPTSASIRNLGLRPSAFIDAGSLWDITAPALNNIGTICSPNTGVTGGTILGAPGAICPGAGAAGQIATDDYNRTNGFKEEFLGNSPKPRLSIGIGVNWVSPFGPLRLDLAKALIKQKGDDTKLFSFNVGTQF